MTELRNLPSIDRLLNVPTTGDLIRDYGRKLTTQALRVAVEHFRKDYSPDKLIPGDDEFVQRAEALLFDWFSPTLQSVINATGVILHTNLGRSPLSQESIQAVGAVMQAYNTLEFNLKSGKRGSRLIHAEDLLKQLTGVEAALVVNNNASAVLLALTALAHRQRVVISRTQMVEIGGGFRIPDVMKQSGARLVEVGTTNRVHMKDYELALLQPTAMILRAHHSNYKIIGFTSEPDLLEIAVLAHKHGLILMDDLGSGALLDTSQFGLAKEPMVQDSIQAGADLVCFSGDKLLGGPQAGILIGKKNLIEKIKHHPLARAVRADKMCLAALSTTLMHYLKGEAEEKIPIWQMISSSPQKMKQQAKSWKDKLGFGEVVASHSTVGGGSLPGELLPTYALRIETPHPDKFLDRLRGQNPPVIARIEDDALFFDPRTIFSEDEPTMLQSIRAVYSFLGKDPR
jgi:L-seryl-tRNA(Ser) seleniumtransferase